MRNNEVYGDMTAWIAAHAGDNESDLMRLKRNLRLAREEELTARQRELLRLRYEENMTVTEIAAAIGRDKSTVSRTLSLFLSHHLVHSIDDGSGALKYAVCSNTCTCEVEDLHVHFYCTQCHRTLCLRGLPVPLVHLPDGFTLESVNYVMKGVCSDCQRKHN